MNPRKEFIVDMEKEGFKAKMKRLKDKGVALKSRIESDLERQEMASMERKRMQLERLKQKNERVSERYRLELAINQEHNKINKLRDASLREREKRVARFLPGGGYPENKERFSFFGQPINEPARGRRKKQKRF